jgi:uncharacterized protein with von Willebrand factor type A (vWA) domain
MSRQIKVWEERAYRDYDSDRELGTRNIKITITPKQIVFVDQESWADKALAQPTTYSQ